MTTTPPPAGPTCPTDTRRFALAWLAVAVVGFLAHFTLLDGMGLYEDDHCLIGTVMCKPDSRGSYRELKHWAGPSYQGRPLQYVIGAQLAFRTTRIGGLPLAFLAAAAILAANAGLFLGLVWRPLGPAWATLAALVFVLFPADTSRPMLHVAFFVHPSVTFLLLSGHAYARGRPALSVFAAGLTLVTYETCFPVAAAWPLLFDPPAGRPVRRALVHGAALAAVLVLAVFARRYMGEWRMAEAMGDKSALAGKVFELVTAGPAAAAGTLVTRPADGLDATAWTPAALAAAAAGVVMLAAFAATRGGAPAGHPGGAYGRAALAGAAMVVLGYAGAVNRDPTCVAGRLSSVHIASTAGWALLVTGLAGLAARAVAPGDRWVLAPVAAAYLSLLVGFHVSVQRELVRSWDEQREFWRTVMTECPDVGPGTVILYPIQPHTDLAISQGWCDYLIFRYLFEVPAGWSSPPMAFPVGHHLWGKVPPDLAGYDWSQEVESKDGKLYWKHWVGDRPLLEPGNVIVITRTPDGGYRRMTGTIPLGGTDFPLKPPGGPAFDFRPRRLYPAMFREGAAVPSPLAAASR
jgi:hypothetical protein